MDFSTSPNPQFNIILCHEIFLDFLLADLEVLVIYFLCGESSFAILRLKFNETATVSALENPTFAIHKFVFDSAH